jgi:TonB family protein
MKPRPLSSLLLLLALAVTSAPAASAQSLNKQAIRQQLEHTAVLLRGRYVCPKPKPCTLVFNQQGQLQSAATVAPLALSAIYVDSVKFRSQALLLRALPATLVRISKAAPPQISALAFKRGRLTIQIDINPSRPSELQKTLGIIFVSNIQQALNAEPPQEGQADLASLPLLTPTTDAQAKSQLKYVGWPAKPVLDVSRKNGVSPPKLIYSPEPSYTHLAKKHKIQGFCDLYLIVNTQGFPENIRVVKTLPDGLDERALAAVSQYRFRPAMQNGKPVPIRMIVEMRFRLW